MLMRLVHLGGCLCELLAALAACVQVCSNAGTFDLKFTVDNGVENLLSTVGVSGTGCSVTPDKGKDVQLSEQRVAGGGF